MNRNNAGCAVLLGSVLIALVLLLESAPGKSGEALGQGFEIVVAGVGLMILLINMKDLKIWAKDKGLQHWLCFSIALVFCLSRIVDVQAIIWMVMEKFVGGAWGFVEWVGDRMDRENLGAAVFIWFPLTIIVWLAFMILFVPIAIIVGLLTSLDTWGLGGWMTVNVLYSLLLAFTFKSVVFPVLYRALRGIWPALAVLIYGVFIAVPPGAVRKLARGGRAHVRVRRKMDLAIGITAGLLALLVHFGSWSDFFSKTPARASPRSGMGELIHNFNPYKKR